MPWDYIKDGYYRPSLMVALSVLALIAGGTAAFASAVAPWATALFGATLAWVVVEFGARTFLVPKNCYALKSSGEVIDTMTYGPGLHPRQIGDEVTVIRLNPITVKWSVAGVKLADHFVVDLEGQATVSPDPRIAGENGINTYGSWILEGRSEGDDTRGVHNVEHGIQGGISSLVMTVLSETSSDDFDKSPLGLQLLLEAELACYGPPHHNTDFCVDVGGGPTNGTGSILAWYQKHHAKIKAWLDEHAGHFALAYDRALEKEMISHHEGHVGSSHDHTIVTKRAYTPESLKLKQAEKAAQEKGKGTVAEAEAAAQVKAIATKAEANATVVRRKAEARGGQRALERLSPEIKKAVADLVDKGVRPEVALAAAMKQAGLEPGFTPQVFSAGGKDGGKTASKAADAAVTGAGVAVGMNAVNNPPQAGGGAP